MPEFGLFSIINGVIASIFHGAIMTLCFFLVALFSDFILLAIKTIKSLSFLSFKDAVKSFNSDFVYSIDSSTGVMQHAKDFIFCFIYGVSFIFLLFFVSDGIIRIYPFILSIISYKLVSLISKRVMNILKVVLLKLVYRINFLFIVLLNFLFNPIKLCLKYTTSFFKKFFFKINKKNKRKLLNKSTFNGPLFIVDKNKHSVTRKNIG